MEDQIGGDQPGTPRASDQPSWISRRIRAVKRQLQERRAHKQHESTIDRAARSTARATWLIGALTLATLGVSYATYHILGGQLVSMQAQLKEMKAARESGDRSAAGQLAQMKAQTDAMQGQIGQMKAANAETERAIVATNQLAEATAQEVFESHRIAAAAERSVNETRRLADAATKSNIIAHQNLVSTQRASVGIKDFQIQSIHDLGNMGFYIVHIVWVNSGNSPTTGLKARIGCMDSNVLAIDPYTIREKQGNVTRFRLPSIEFNDIVIAPRQTENIGECPVTYENAGKGIPPKKFTYFLGRASYKDTFNPKTFHVLEFCYMYMSFGILDPSVQAVREGLAPCQVHNCTDDECSKETREAAIRGDPLPIPPIK